MLNQRLEELRSREVIVLSELAAWERECVLRKHGIDPYASGGDEGEAGGGVAGDGAPARLRSG